jgi:hypothetical protein
MNNEAKIEVIPGSEFAKPSDRPVLGDKRLVRYLPVPLPGMSGMLMPCLWISEYEVFDEDLKVKVKKCLVLMSKGPPHPEIVCVTIPSDAIEKFPTGPVEW